MAQWAMVGSSYGGGVGYKLVSDLGFSEIDKALNRQNLPVEQKVRTWLDTAVALGAAYYEGEYGDRGGNPRMHDAILGAGIVAAANVVEAGETAAKLGPYSKKYTLVQGGAKMGQTPAYKTTRTGF